jgi:hypothetical protein
MNKTLVLAILAVIILIGLADAKVTGIKITNVGPTTNLIAGNPNPYTFTVTFECTRDSAEWLDPVGSQPVLGGVQLHYIDGGTDLTSPCPNCDCDTTHRLTCSCTTTQAITALTAAQETKDINFAVDAGGYSAAYKAITVYAPADEAILSSRCGNLSSSVNALGEHCWEYDEGEYNIGPKPWDNNGFHCIAPASPASGFQVNVGKPCVVNCKESAKKACKCSAVTACVDKCVENVIRPFCTEVPNFDCSLSAEYNCAVNGVRPYVRCDNTKTCKAACAQGCGRETVFGTKCEENCNLVTCNKASYTKDEKDNCMGACVSMCKINEEMCSLMLILELAAALIAAIMLAINGLKWIMSEDPGARNAARGGISYVIVGIIVVLMALVLVSLILNVSLICYF